MKTQNLIRAVIYIRVSSEEQVRHGYSLQSQKERLLEYCKMKQYQVTNIYADEGKTARSKLKNRTALLSLIEDAKKHEFDRIVFWRLDRWFRNIADYYKVQEILDQNKIDWECSDEEYNTTTSNGRLHLNIKLSIAQNESDQTSDRIKFNFSNMVKNGKPIAGSQCLPLGFIVVGEKHNKRVVKDPETRDIVDDMWSYGLMVRSIRRTLLYVNNKYNLSIVYDSMRHYLQNPLYYGTYRDNDSFCESYITKEQYDLMQSYIRRNYRENKRYDYIFSGLLKCPICGRKLAGFQTKMSKAKHGLKYPGYKCNYAYNSEMCTYRKRVGEKTLEKYLLDSIQAEIKKYIFEIERVEDSSSKNITTIDVEKIKRKLSRLTDLYIDEKISRETYDENFEKLNNQLKEAAVQNNHVEKRDLSVYKALLNDNSILDLYNRLDNRSKRNFWLNYIDYIVKDIDGTYHVYFK